MKILIYFLIIISSGCSAGYTTTQISNQTNLTPQPTINDTLIICIDKNTNQNIEYFKSYSRKSKLGNDFFNVDILEIVDKNGIYHILNNLELLNYDCKEHSIP